MVRHDMIILKRDGFYTRDWEYDEEREEGEYVETRLNTEEDWDLLECWNTNMTVDEGVLTGDFFKILQKMDEGLLDVISMLTNSNIAGYLKTVPILNVAKDDENELRWVEVYKNIEIDNHADLENPEYSEYTCAHGVGKPWKDGPGVESNMTDEEKEKLGCNTYALEFTPWMDLKNVPLRIRPKAYLSETVWYKGEKKRKIGSNGPDDEDGWNCSDRELDRDKLVRREIDYTMTLGEFLSGITNELCFFSSPERAEEKKAELIERVKDVEEQIEKERKKEE
jgi:hypothetical protein